VRCTARLSPEQDGDSLDRSGGQPGRSHGDRRPAPAGELGLNASPTGALCTSYPVTVSWSSPGDCISVDELMVTLT